MRTRRKDRKVKRPKRPLHGAHAPNRAKWATEAIERDQDILEHRRNVQRLQAEVARLSGIIGSLNGTRSEQEGIADQTYRKLAGKLKGLKPKNRHIARTSTVEAFTYEPNTNTPVMYLDWLNAALVRFKASSVLAIVMSDTTSALCFGSCGVLTYGDFPVVSSPLIGEGLLILVGKRRLKTA